MRLTKKFVIAGLTRNLLAINCISYEIADQVRNDRLFTQSLKSAMTRAFLISLEDILLRGDLSDLDKFLTIIERNKKTWTLPF